MKNYLTFYFCLISFHAFLQKMRLVILIQLCICSSCGFAQRIETYPENEPPKIDLIIVIFDQELNAPVINAKVILVGSEGLNEVGYTDSTGRLEYLHSNDSVHLVVNQTYTIEVEGVLKKYLGTEDAFSTHNITSNTRLVRELRIVGTCKVRMRMPFLHFENNSVLLDNFSKGSLNYLYELMIEHPNIILEVNSMYEKDAEQQTAQKRADAVVTRMLELGIPSERFVILIERRFEGEYDSQIDVAFRILSFDYVPKK